MSISFSGLASGLDTSSWVDALVSVKQSKVTDLRTKLKETQTKKTSLNDTRSTFSSFRSALEKITDKKFGGVYDLFNVNSATSTNSDIFTATAASGALRQNYNIEVQQLATYTKAYSRSSASSVADDSTVLTKLGIKEGDIAVYVDGLKTTIHIGKEDTFGDFKSQLNAAGIDAQIDEDGVLRLSSQDPEKDIYVGSTTDTTNIASLVGLARQENGTYASTNCMFKANVNTKLTDENSGFKARITEGTFTIGDATFTIGQSTTLSSLISQINDSEEAQASAYWDDTSGKLIITSKKEGASYINIESGTSNFTDVMQLTETTYDEYGNPESSRMFTDSQELGKNAIFTVNGTRITSTSNTVTEDVSRITGVTLTLNRVTTDEDKEATLKVDQDTSGLVDALKSFVEAYNNTIKKIDEVTGSEGDLKRESSLTSFKNTIRNMAMGSSSAADGVYKALSQIGITGNKADGNNISDDAGTLVFDEKVFLQALQENPESVSAILADENGILNQMENTVEGALKAVSGFFDVKQTSLDNEIKKSEQKITKQQEKIALYKAQLEKKFSAMEQIMSKMQQNYSSFLTQ